MHYYAQQSPRGFVNEVNTYRFRSRADRDAFVSAHASDGDVSSAACGARAVTARQAHATVGYRGDAATQNFNSGFIDC